MYQIIFFAIIAIALIILAYFIGKDAGYAESMKVLESLIRKAKEEEEEERRKFR